MTETVACVVVFLVLLFPVFPQPRLQTDHPTGVKIVKASWRKLTYRPGWDTPQDPASRQELEDARNGSARDSNSNPTTNTLPISSGLVVVRAPERPEPRKSSRAMPESDPSPGAVAPERRVEQYAYEIKILNTGEKNLEVIDWEYSFPESDVATESTGRRFLTFNRIKPGNSLTLKGISFAPPTRVLNATASSDGRQALESRIVIRCILYSDGTFSRRANGSDTDCDAIKNHRKRR